MDLLRIPTMMLPGPRRVLAVLVCLASMAGPVCGADAENAKWKKRWRISAAAFAISSVLDFSSSVGRYETNPLLRNANGRFSVGKGAAVKGGLLAGMLLAQAWAMRGRKDPAIVRAATISNYGAAAAVTAVSIRNRTVPR
jgi:hypothetical protein